MGADKQVQETLVREYTLSWSEWMKMHMKHTVLSVTAAGVRVQIVWNR
jgi:hypothetical protein